MGFARIALHVKRIDWFSNRFDHFLCWLSEKLVFAQSIGFPIDLTTFYNHWHPPMLSDSLGFVGERQMSQRFCTSRRPIFVICSRYRCTSQLKLPIFKMSTTSPKMTLLSLLRDPIFGDFGAFADFLSL